ncbi:hypothetical protein [Virgibacillus sp. MG-45]|uniref:hypothetical protein n=1 Tax=Virgibacillus sp. MG-45 TaxID=3102791 RepID=UPI002EDADB18
MSLFTFWNEVKGGEIIYSIFLFGMIPMVIFILKYKHNPSSKLQILVGMFIFFVISLIASTTIINLLFFPQGEYVNHGAVLAGILTLFSVFSALLIGCISSLFYFKLVGKK